MNNIMTFNDTIYNECTCEDIADGNTQLIRFSLCEQCYFFDRYNNYICQINGESIEGFIKYYDNQCPNGVW